MNNEGKNQQSDELKLWESFRSGSEKALEGLFSAYYSRLLNYGHKFTFDRYFVEESIQDLFVRLWNNRLTVGETANVKHYLFKSYRSVLIRKLQRRASNIMEKLNDERYEFKIELAADQKMIEIESEKELKAKIEESLAALTPRQREAVYLRFYEDLSYEEVSEVLNLTIGSTYKLIYRALDRLKEKLGATLLSALLTALRLHHLVIS